MDLIQSFIAIAEAAARKEEQQTKAAFNPEVHSKVCSLEIVQPQQASQVKLPLPEAETELVA